MTIYGAGLALMLLMLPDENGRVALQVLKAGVVAPYLLLAWTVYAGLLPITALWGAAALSVLPGRSFVAFAQVSIAAMGGRNGKPS